MPWTKHHCSHWGYSKEEDKVLAVELASPGVGAGQFYLSSYYLPGIDLGGHRDGVLRRKKYHLSLQKACDLKGNSNVYTIAHTTKQNM